MIAASLGNTELLKLGKLRGQPLKCEKIGIKDAVLFLEMNSDEPDDFFFLEGGDELLNSEPCPKCKEPIYLDQAIEWVDRKGGKRIFL